MVSHLRHFYYKKNHALDLDSRCKLLDFEDLLSINYKIARFMGVSSVLDTTHVTYTHHKT